MQRVGFVRPVDTASHHIVPHREYANNPNVQAINKKLADHGIGVNEAANGVYLPKNLPVAKPPAATHSKVHTETYFKNVADRLKGLNSPAAICAELQKIAKEVGEGTF